MAKGVAVFKLLLRDIPQFESNVQMALYFECRAIGHGEEAHEVLAAGTPKTYGHIRHNRNSRAPNLVAQTEVTRERFLLRNLVYGDRQFLRFLPSLDIFESLNLHAKTLHHKPPSLQPETN